MSVSGIGQLVDGKYELVEIAGEGGMATVFRAVVKGAAGFTRSVAVKKIRPEYRAIKNYIDMFVEEARVGSDLAHPNIVQVYDFCTDELGAYFLVMEWVEGIDLGSFIRSFRDHGLLVPWPLVAGIGVGTLRGLGAAHERKRDDGTPAPVIHRDVSPHNILLGVNGVVKLTDFGLARARDRVFSLTAPGTVKGKLSYLSPEVSWGKAATAQSDLFSMGAVLWEALSGQRLFDGRTDLEIFRKIRDCQIPPIDGVRADVPPALIAVIERALYREADLRFATAQQFAFALTEVLRTANLGGDAQQALGVAVLDARRRLARKPSHSDTHPTWTFDTSDVRENTGESREITFSSPGLAVDPKFDPGQNKK